MPALLYILFLQKMREITNGGASKNTVTLLDACNQHRNERPDHFWPCPSCIRTESKQRVHITVHGYPMQLSAIRETALPCTLLQININSSLRNRLRKRHRFFFLLNSPSLIIYHHTMSYLNNLPKVPYSVWASNIKKDRFDLPFRSCPTFFNEPSTVLLNHGLSKIVYVTGIMLKNQIKLELSLSRMPTYFPLSHDAWERH